MKKAIWITIGVLFFLFCVYTSFKPMLPEKVDPNKYLTDEKGYAIKSPLGEYFLPYSGNKGDTKEENEVCYISGVWRWNEKLEEPEGYGDGISKLADLNFSTAKKDGHSSLIYAKEDYGFALYYSDYDTGGVYIRDLGWLDETARLIDFGGEFQQVSKRVYEFITSNAVPAQKEEYIETITDYNDSLKEVSLSGYWVWNKEISVASLKTKAMKIDICGQLSNGETVNVYEIYMVLNRGIWELDCALGEATKAQRPVWLGDGSGWYDDKERYIYLGEQEQTVTAEVYSFFVSNAHPCTKEEFDAMAVKDASETSRETRNYFEGSYQWIDVPFAEYLIMCGDRWEEHDLNVQSNGKTFTSLYGIYDAETELYEVYYGNQQEQIMVFSSETGWTDEAFKTIVFSERAYVYMETYSHFDTQLLRVEINN